MTDPDDSAFADRIETAIRDAITAGETGPDTAGMTGPWVLVAVTYDSHGTRGMTLTTADRQPLDSSLGLLEIARTVYQQEARNWVMGEEG